MFAFLQQAPAATTTLRATTRLSTFPEGGLSGVRHLDPFRVGRGVRDVTVVQVPPFVRPGLRIAIRRILPLLLASERRHVEVAPDGTHRFVATAADPIGTEHALAFADERIVAV